MSRALDRNGLAHNDCRDLDWFGPEMPYVQYGGGSLTLLLEPKCSKLQRGAYKPSSSEGMVRSLSYVSRVPLLYFKVGPPTYISLFLACSSFPLERALRSCQLAGPAPPVGSGGIPPDQFSWATGLRAPIPTRSVGTVPLLNQGLAVVPSSVHPYHLCTSFHVRVLTWAWHVSRRALSYCQAASPGHHNPA